MVGTARVSASSKNLRARILKNMDQEYPQNNLYYSMILVSFVISICCILLDIVYIHPSEGWFVWLWNLWANIIFIQWIVYALRMLQVRHHFRQSKKDGTRIQLDPTHQTWKLFQCLFCIPWWATKVDNVAIELIAEEYGIHLQKLSEYDTADYKQSTATL